MTALAGIVGLLVIVVIVFLAVGLLRAAPEAAFRPVMAITAVEDDASRALYDLEKRYDRD